MAAGIIQLTQYATGGLAVFHELAGGFYHPCPDKVKAGMRPSATLTNILATLG